jgi:hypothetical protein
VEVIMRRPDLKLLTELIILATALVSLACTLLERGS